MPMTKYCFSQYQLSSISCRGWEASNMWRSFYTFISAGPNAILQLFPTTRFCGGCEQGCRTRIRATNLSLIPVSLHFYLHLGVWADGMGVMEHSDQRSLHFTPRSIRSRFFLFDSITLELQCAGPSIPGSRIEKLVLLRSGIFVFSWKFNDLSDSSMDRRQQSPPTGCQGSAGA
ncbi:hypothetical protein BJ165DRAFT_1472836 [Panaeolus papilionaceus]|nr:hypothetical protein BJ165DRAFT_1472836 [Panaeolus papilionaceus]